MPDHDENPQDPTDGGLGGPKTDPPVSPPTAPPPKNQTLTQLLLAAAGVSTLAALLAFLLGCLGDSGVIAVEFGILLAVLGIVLDAASVQTLGGLGGPKTDPPVSPPSLAYVTAATIATALGLLAILIECVIEREHGVGTLVGLLLLLLAAVADFTAAYKASPVRSAGG